MLSSTQQKKMQDLQEMRDPSLRMARMLNERSQAKAVDKMNLVKGEPGKDGKDGYTPVKGKDYFTNDDVNSVLKYIKSQVVKDGKNGKDGVSIRGKDGKDGETPVRGVHYWTAEDQLMIREAIRRMMPKPKDGVSPKIEDILTELKKQPTKPIQYDEIQGAPKIKDLNDLVMFLKIGGFRGGGSGGGGTSTPTGGVEIPTGTVDGSNNIFTVLNVPIYAVVDGIVRFSGNGYTYSSGTLTIDPLAPPTQSIRSIYSFNVSGLGLVNSIVAGTTNVIINSSDPSNPIINVTAQAPISLTTTGTSGAATFAGNVLNVPNYTLGASNGFQRPISGVVDGFNKIFVFVSAPNVLVSDEGRTFQKLQSDGLTANWTGTTTITLTVAPTFDLFATA